jgi:hypothetical protein
MVHAQHLVNILDKVSRPFYSFPHTYTQTYIQQIHLSFSHKFFTYFIISQYFVVYLCCLGTPAMQLGASRSGACITSLGNKYISLTSHRNYCFVLTRRYRKRNLFLFLLKIFQTHAGRGKFRKEKTIKMLLLTILLCQHPFNNV